jgi:hypothetical protein
MKIKVWQLALAAGMVAAAGALYLFGAVVTATALAGLAALVLLAVLRPPRTTHSRMIPAASATSAALGWYPRCSRGCHLLVNASYDPHTGESLAGSPSRPARPPSFREAFTRSWKMRVAALGAVAALGSVGATASAAGWGSGRPRAAGVDAASAEHVASRSAPTVLTVPAVSSGAFVFAKIALSDAGFAWRVCGQTQGYAGNVVSSQSPAAGSRISTRGGTPVVRIWLKPNRAYRERGVPDDSGPLSSLGTWSASTSPRSGSAGC